MSLKIPDQHTYVVSITISEYAMPFFHWTTFFSWNCICYWIQIIQFPLFGNFETFSIWLQVSRVFLKNNTPSIFGCCLDRKNILRKRWDVEGFMQDCVTCDTFWVGETDMCIAYSTRFSALLPSANSIACFDGSNEFEKFVNLDLSVIICDLAPLSTRTNLCYRLTMDHFVYEMDLELTLWTQMLEVCLCHHLRLVGE